MSETNAKLISGERVVFSTRKHWAALLLDSGWAILMVLGSFVLAWVQPDTNGGVLGFFGRVIGLLGLGLFLGGCGWIIYNVVAWRTAEYAVTNRRVLGQEGLLRRRSTDALLSSVSDIRTVSPALGRLLGYGHVRIISAAGEAGKDRLSAVRGAETFKQQVLEQKAGTAALRPGASTSAAPASGAETASQIMQLLAELAKLRDAGAITGDEYEAKKAEWLGRI
jgi:uncharacterized membrane protein YdbT with pleckstrin-like domain